MGFCRGPCRAPLQKALFFSFSPSSCLRLCVCWSNLECGQAVLLCVAGRWLRNRIAVLECGLEPISGWVELKKRRKMGRGEESVWATAAEEHTSCSSWFFGRASRRPLFIFPFICPLNQAVLFIIHALLALFWHQILNLGPAIFYANLCDFHNTFWTCSRWERAP